MNTIPRVERVPSGATYEEISKRIESTYGNIQKNKEKLGNILTKKNIVVTQEDGLTELVEKVKDTMIKPTIYGVRVDESNPNPETAITYIENAIGVTPATPTSLGGWEDKFPFNNIKIVAHQKGKELKEIKKENKLQYVDGTNVDTSDYSINIFTKIPKFYWNFKRINEDVYEVRIAAEKVNDDYVCYAHTVGNTEKDNIYVGVYYPFRKSGGGTEGNLFRSASGLVADSWVYLYNARTYTANSGCGVGGYTTYGWFTHCMLRILYLIAYKNLDSENALGVGRNDSSFTTGLGDTKGFIYGSQDNTEPNVFLGIEHFIAGRDDLIDGLYVKDRNVYLNFKNLNYGTTSEYTNTNYVLNNPSVYGFANRVAATNELCFLPIEYTGSSSTNYCDYAYNSLDSHTYTYAVGGEKVYQERGKDGVFALSLSQHDATSGQSSSCRLCFVGTDNGLPVG